MADQANQLAALDAARLEQDLGLPFLAFMLNASEDQVRDRLQAGTALDRRKEAALAEVAQAVAQIFPASSTVAYGALPSVLLGYNPTQGTSGVNALRASAGGKIPATTAKADTPDESLEQLAIDCYAAALLPASSDLPQIPGRIEHLTTVVHRHPRKVEFETRVMADKELAPLFPDHSESAGRTGAYYTNLGHGGSIQLWMLAEGLISAGYSSLALDNSAEYESVVARVVENLRGLRKLVAGKGVASKARLGIAGIQLQGVDKFETPWGILRPSTPEEVARVRMGPATPTDAVLEVPITLKLYLGSGLPPEGQTGPGKLGEVSAKLHNDLKDRWTKLALSIFLGTEDDQPIAGAHSWTMFDEVFTGVSGMSFSPLAWGGSWALPADQLSRVSEWAQRIDQHYHRSISVATDRIIKAVAHQRDPADALVDAVIALENLFGTSSAQGEVVFRVSSGCAWLLETTPDGRKTLRKRVREIYDERSKIVHGNPPSDDAWKHRQEAVELVRRSLRILLKDRPDLITNRDRSSELTIGG